MHAPLDRATILVAESNDSQFAQAVTYFYLVQGWRQLTTKPSEVQWAHACIKEAHTKKRKLPMTTRLLNEPPVCLVDSPVFCLCRNGISVTSPCTAAANGFRACVRVSHAASKVCSLNHWLRHRQSRAARMTLRHRQRARKVCQCWTLVFSEREYTIRWEASPEQSSFFPWAGVGKWYHVRYSRAAVEQGTLWYSHQHIQDPVSVLQTPSIAALFTHWSGWVGLRWSGCRQPYWFRSSFRLFLSPGIMNRARSTPPDFRFIRGIDVIGTTIYARGIYLGCKHRAFLEPENAAGWNGFNGSVIQDRSSTRWFLYCAGLASGLQESEYRPAVVCALPVVVCGYRPAGVHV